MSVTALEIQRRELVLNGRGFGSTGAYEKILGTLRFTVDPTLPIHAEVTDLDRAPRNSGGLVEGSADFYMLRPFGGGNRALLLDVPRTATVVASSEVTLVVMHERDFRAMEEEIPQIRDRIGAVMEERRARAAQEND